MGTDPDRLFLSLNYENKADKGRSVSEQNHSGKKKGEEVRWLTDLQETETQELDIQETGMQDPGTLELGIQETGMQETDVIFTIIVDNLKIYHY